MAMGYDKVQAATITARMYIQAARDENTQLQRLLEGGYRDHEHFVGELAEIVLPEGTAKYNGDADNEKTLLLDSLFLVLDMADWKQVAQECGFPYLGEGVEG
jgi:hypothetical protein